MRNIWLWMFVLLLFSIVDFVCTAYGIDKGYFRELNPIMIWVMSKFGIFGILYAKLFVLLALFIGLIYPKEFMPAYAKRVDLYVKVATIGQGLVAVWGSVMTMWWIYG